jgi:hypothetical protein
MSETKLIIFVLGVVLTFVLTVATIIFVAMPKAALVDAWTSSKVHIFKDKVNECNELGGSAYVTDKNRVLCERAAR